MRKWMRERLQRRKKSPAEASGQPAPPPLQPAYFDAEQPQEATPHGEAVESSGEKETSASLKPLQGSRPARRARFSTAQHPSDVQASEGELPANPPSEESALPQSSGRSSATSRGRRRRGGRGRGGRGREQAVAQAFAPTAVKGSIPVVPSETGEEVAHEAENDFPDAAPAQVQTLTPAHEAGPKAPAIPAAPPRPPKGVVVLAIGLPGSGKSSWFKRHNVVPLSSDMVRSLLFDDVREQRFQDLVFSNLRSMLKARLIAKRPMNYVDATNLTPQERQHWIKLAKDYQYEVHAIFFDVPLEVCLERHQRRDRVVPEDVMRRMAAKLKPPAFEEGFAKITVVRVKKKEPEAA